MTVVSNSPNFVVDSLGTFAFNHTGEVAVSAELEGGGETGLNNQAMFLATPNAVNIIAREGDPTPLPGFNGDPTVFDFPLSSPSHNSNSNTVFSSDLRGLAVNQGTNSTAIFSINQGNVTTVARQGNLTLGTLPGVNFGSLISRSPGPQVNGSGEILFFSELQGPGVTIAVNNFALFYQSQSERLLVARSGDAVSRSEASFFSGNFRSIQFNDAGQVAFTDTLRGPGGGGVFLWDDSQIYSLVLVGDEAPVAGQDVFFNNFLDSLALNNLGEIAFRSGLSGEGVDETNDVGVFVTATGSATQLIVRTGDVFDVSRDPAIVDERVIRDIDIRKGSEGDNGSSSSFNEVGQLVFHLTFTDDSQGIFLTTLDSAIALSGDYDASGFVSQADLDLVLLNWGDTTLPTGFDVAATGEALFDGLISQNELDSVLLNWGNGTPPNLAIPEPASLAILAATLAFTRRRRSCRTR